MYHWVVCKIGIRIGIQDVFAGSGENHDYPLDFNVRIMNLGRRLASLFIHWSSCLVLSGFGGFGVHLGDLGDFGCI